MIKYGLKEQHSLNPHQRYLAPVENKRLNNSYIRHFWTHTNPYMLEYAVVVQTGESTQKFAIML